MGKYRRYLNLWIGASLAIFLMAGCGGGGGAASSGSQTGTLGVSLTDAAAGGFDAVNVTVSKVRVHQSASAEEGDAGWSEITLDPARKINLLDLQNGVLEDLGETPLPAGHYTQLRLVLDNTEPLANSVVPTGGFETALVPPSGMQSGIKLINEFDVAAGERIDLVLDFDAHKSVSVVNRGNGTYALRPVIKVIPTLLNGITGFVDTALLGSNVMVTAQAAGEIVRSTAPTQTGEFFLARLPLGEYDVVITADGRATAVITGVPVTSDTSITTLSTIGEPITLPVPDSPADPTTHDISGTVTLDPSSTEVAYVAAKQEIATGLTVIVKSQTVDPTTSGDYSLTLPIAAPLLGEYGDGTLPIALTPQNGAAGKYSVEASATGYTSKESAVLDISAGNEPHNFTLPLVPPAP